MIKSRTQLHRFSPAFTLIELMIVVAIIGVLAAIAIPNFTKFSCRAKQAGQKSFISSMGKAYVAYIGEQTPPANAVGSYPIKEAWCDGLNYNWSWSATNTPYFQSAPSMIIRGKAPHNFYADAYLFTDASGGWAVGIYSVENTYCTGAKLYNVNGSVSDLRWSGGKTDSLGYSGKSGFDIVWDGCS